MRIMAIIILTVSFINITACSSMSGNVVPEKGPTMEDVYDSMEATKPVQHHLNKKYMAHLQTTSNTFYKIPNPELKMYVYPHLAGKDEVPIPGYNTVFNAYTQDHYALPNEL